MLCASIAFASNNGILDIDVASIAKNKPSKIKPEKEIIGTNLTEDQLKDYLKNPPHNGEKYRGNTNDFAYNKIQGGNYVCPGCIGFGLAFPNNVYLFFTLYGKKVEVFTAWNNNGTVEYSKYNGVDFNADNIEKEYFIFALLFQKAITAAAGVAPYGDFNFNFTATGNSLAEVFLNDLKTTFGDSLDVDLNTFSKMLDNGFYFVPSPVRRNDKIVQGLVLVKEKDGPHKITIVESSFDTGEKDKLEIGSIAEKRLTIRDIGDNKVKFTYGDKDYDVISLQ